MTDELIALERWLQQQCGDLSDPMKAYLMGGGSTDDPQYRQQLGQHQAYMRTRSYVSGARAALAQERGE